MDGYVIWVVSALTFLWYAFHKLFTVWLRPLQIQKHFNFQGIEGPPYRLVHGNSREITGMLKRAKSKPMRLCHDIVPRDLPYYDHWSKIYGRTFLHWFGHVPRLTIAEPEMMREILSPNFTKIPPNAISKRLVGNGLLTVEGQKWAYHRKIIGPAFYMKKLEGMIPLIIASAENMLTKLKECVASGDNPVDMSKHIDNFTADAIARTAFGSSYEEGKHIFDMQGEQTLIAAEANRKVMMGIIPGYRFLPTEKNRHGWKLDGDIRKCLRRLIERREKDVERGKSENYGSDLLGLMMATNKNEMGSSHKKMKMSIEEIIDECKTFYFAGHDTTSSLLTWTVILLAMHQDLQERARREVVEICGPHDSHEYLINSTSLKRLSVVEMILKEVLRLYPPVTGLFRQSSEGRIIGGNLSVPAETQIFMPIIAVHHDPLVWGEDVNDFNPERFGKGGVSTGGVGFMPFGMGARTCVGQNFAMVEAKVVLAMLLRTFSFQLSPLYVHAPSTVLSLHPQHGAPITLNHELP